MFLRMLVFSWKNIWRNTRRTVITGLAVGLGLASLLFTEGLMVGMSIHMIDATTNPWMGDAQIHRSGFLETRQLELTVNRGDTLQQMLSGDTLVISYTDRILSPASIASARELKPVNLVGVDRRTDPSVTMLQSAVDTGEYFSGDSMEIIIGHKLARDLEVELGDVLVITAAHVDSGLSSSMYILSGICDFGSDQLDRYSAFVNIGSAENLLGLEGRFHEIAVEFSSPDIATDGQLDFWNIYSRFGNVAEGWPDLAPQLDSMMGMTDVSMYIMSVILMGLVAFGIVNSLFMSVYERMFELGIMKAVGTRPLTVGSMVMMEAFWLGMLSTFIGLVIGLGVIGIFSGSGISFGEIEFTGIILDKPIYPSIEFTRILMYSAFTLLLTTIAGVFPGLHAARQNPAEAMRRSL